MAAILDCNMSDDHVGLFWELCDMVSFMEKKVGKKVSKAAVLRIFIKWLTRRQNLLASLLWLI